MENELITLLTTLITIPTLIIFEAKIFYKRETYKLIQRNKYQNFKVIHVTPQIKEIKNIKNNNMLDIKIKQIISHFINTLSNHLSKEELKIVKQNINNLEFKEKSPYLLISPYTGGFYIAKDHSICISTIVNPKDELYKHVLYHELLHSITTCKENNIVYMGFAQKETNTLKKIGYMINEGYTELLTSRLFGKSDLIGYKYEVAIAKLIEHIIGKDKMKELYFKADLNGLINELTKYHEINKVKQLILNLDTIHHLYHKNKSNREREILVKLYNENSTILYELFTNKTNQTIAIDTIDTYKEESNKFLQLFEETNKHIVFNEEEKYKKEEETSKKLVRTKSNKGFITIITINTLLIVIFLVSILVSCLLLQAR